jgi:hypothetical protein
MGLIPSIVRANVEPCCCGRLNTLLELKVENERLQRHISALRAHSQQLSATQVIQDMGPYAGDNLSTQLAANLGFAARSTLGGDSSRPHYLPMAHGYEASSGFSGIPVLDDDGDTEPRRKKVNRLMIRFESAIGLTLLSQLKKSSGGEQYICNTCGRTDSPEWRKVDLMTLPL